MCQTTIFFFFFGKCLKRQRALIQALSAPAETSVCLVYFICFAILSILIYIWFRFEWHFGFGAVVALIHDVLITLGILSIFKVDFNLSTISQIYVDLYFKMFNSHTSILKIKFLGI